MTAPNTPSGGASSTGLSQNVAGALAYLLGPITGILFLVIEKENKFVRFHAMQSTALCVIWIILSVGLSMLTAVPVLGWIAGLLVSFVLGIVGFILWLVLMWKAFQGEEWQLPLVGPFSHKQVYGAA